jgi:hypothetical protein
LNESYLHPPSLSGQTIICPYEIPILDI